MLSANKHSRRTDRTQLLQSRSTAGISLVVSALTAVLVAAAPVKQEGSPKQSPPKMHPKLEPFRPLLGKTFTGAFDSPTPENPPVDVQKWERILNGKAVRLMHSLNQGQYGGETIFRWDASKKSVVFHYFTTAGFMTTGTVTVRGTGWTSHEVVQGGETSIKEVKAETQPLEDGSLQVSTRLLKDGEWVPGSTVIYRLTPKAKVVFR